jgi:hypothetical protein
MMCSFSNQNSTKGATLMANALVIFDGNGPLPQKATFNSPTDGSVVFAISGTAWTQNAATLLGFDLLVDGNDVGQAMCFANNNASHQAMRTTFIPYSGLTIGDHTITITPSNAATVTDTNDYFQVVLFY